MRALVFTSADPRVPPEWRLDVPVPTPADNEILVSVRSVGLNRADLQRRAAFYGEQASGLHIAGLEMAGEVLDVGPGVIRHKVGDRVMAAVGSACADCVTVHECMACPVPQGYSWNEAAATYVCFSTAYDALARHAAMQRGESVLIQGASSGVGMAAVQLARHLEAGHVAGTSRSAEKLTQLIPLGLAQGWTGAADEADIGAPAGNARGFDVVLDLVGSAVADRSLDALALKGRWVSVGRISQEPALIDLGKLAHKGAVLIGLASRMRSVQEHADVIDDFSKNLLPPLEKRLIHPVLDRVFSMEDAAAAFTYILPGAHYGKVVIGWASTPI